MADHLELPRDVRGMTGRGRRCRAGWAFLVVLLVVMFGPGSTRTGGAVGQCGRARQSRPLVVGVRGSGEKEGDANGLGKTVQAAVGAFGQTFAKPFDTEHINYPAAPIDVLAIAKKGLAFWPNYRDSVLVGVNDLVDRLSLEGRTCPGRPIVVIGYSQGALVVNRSLVALVASHDPVLGQLAAVALVADPQRIGTSFYVRGDAPQTLNGLTIALRLMPGEQIPDAIAARTQSWCHKGDIVCATNPAQVASFLAGIPVALAVLKRGFDVHTGYVARGDAQDAGIRAAHQLVSFLKRPLSDAELAVRVGCITACTVTGSIKFSHPTWGPSVLVTTLPRPVGCGTPQPRVLVLDAQGRVRWQRTFQDCFETLAPFSTPRDRTGHLLVTYNPGRYDGVIVLNPVPGGMEDFGSLPPAGDYAGRFYFAELKDIDGDGKFEIVASNTECGLGCAGEAAATITTSVYRWNGTEYVSGGPTGFRAFVADWSMHLGDLKVSARRTAFLGYATYRYCGSDPTPPCDRSQAPGDPAGWGVRLFLRIVTVSGNVAIAKVTRTNTSAIAVGSTYRLTLQSPGIIATGPEGNSYWCDPPHRGNQDCGA